MKYAIKNRWNGSVIFEDEIECAADESEGVKLGLAVRRAVKAGVNLAESNLTGVNLARACLTGVNLTGVKAYGYTFNRAPIQLYDRYSIEIWDGFMKVGCEVHLLSEWHGFDDRRILEMDGKGALEWWQKWKPALFALAEAGDRMELPEQPAQEQAA
ncbi:MAG: hypothetical protein EOM20_20305 [Spartobacteria bacterium]|nr:hypothetical protein [Spartobacteria bacterium]